MVTHDHARSIGPVLEEIDESRTVLERSGVTLDVLVVDDGSSDDTIDAARASADRLGLELEVLKAARRGRVPALLEGLRQCSGEGPYGFIVTLDAGGEHDARQIPDLVRAHLARGHGVTIGSRWVRGGSSPGTNLPRLVLSRLANAVARQVSGLRGVRDATTTFRVFHPDVAALVPPAAALGESAGFFVGVTALAQAQGFAIGEVPITFRPRYSGVAPLTPMEARRFLAGLWATRRAARAVRDEHRNDQTDWAKRQPHFAGQEPAADSHFGALDELVALAGAERFFSWIVDSFGDALGPRTLEVGAGLGTVSRLITERRPGVSVVALEPAANVFPGLADTAARNPGLTARQTTSGELLAEGAAGTFDSVVYVNVMEHIEADVAEMEVARQLLAPGGHLCLFVPAMPSLYSNIDHKSGHYRRYTKSGLADKITAAGFEIERLDYFDVASIIPYWVVYRLLGTERLGGASNAMYDKVLVPASQLAQRILRHPPIGKNLLAVARRVS
jgi:SAM-dependent methyltransferase